MGYNINGLSSNKGIKFSSKGVLVTNFKNKNIQKIEKKNKLISFFLFIIFVYIVFLKLVKLYLYAILLLPLSLLLICFYYVLFGSEFRGYHAAEHMAINAYYSDGYVDFYNIKEYPKVSKKCGTTLIVLIFSKLTIFGIINLIFAYAAIYTLLLLLFIYLLYDYLIGDKKIEFIYGYIYPISLFLQEKFLTTYPSDNKIRTAVEGINHLVILLK